MRYYIEVSYKGTNYSGWQIQKNRTTIQGCITDALTNIMQAPTTCMGSSRTDAGVHARQSFAMFESSKKLPHDFLNRINKVLADDIAVSRIIPVNEDQNVRYDVIQRSYEYHLHFTKDPLLVGLSYLCPYRDLDLKAMRKTAKLLCGYSNFAMLSRRDKQKSTICKLTTSDWQVNEETERWVYHISSDRFLWGMVRRIVGLMVMIGHGRMSNEEFEQAMKSGKPLRINHKTPAEGLYLVSVKYPYI